MRRRPVSSISIACLRATLRESATIGVEQNRPMSTPGVANRRVDGGNCQVATRHKLTTGRGRHALHGGNDRLRQIDDLLHHRAAHRHDVAEIGTPSIGIASAAREFLEIVTRAEGRAVCREHNGPRAARRLLCSVNAAGERGQHFFCQAVARLAVGSARG